MKQEARQGQDDLPKALGHFQAKSQVKFQATDLWFHHQAVVLPFSAAGRTWQRMANKHISKLSACNVSVITPTGDADLLLPHLRADVSPLPEVLYIVKQSS